jgi:hypothetical protein
VEPATGSPPGGIPSSFGSPRTGLSESPREQLFVVYVGVISRTGEGLLYNPWSKMLYLLVL